MSGHEYDPKQHGLSDELVYFTTNEKGQYEIDLLKLRGEGDFPCPGCGVNISPEDETEDVYQILEIKHKGVTLEELVIQCNKCYSKIRLTGFPSFETEEKK